MRSTVKVYKINNAGNILFGTGRDNAMLWDDVKKIVENISELADIENINGIIINVDGNRIVETSGWSLDRGLFYDSYYRG